MKLNNKGYMLVEIVLASVIAMSIGYYLLNLTFKFKNKNEDIYSSTELITDRIVITKNIMNDLEGKVVNINKNVTTDNKTASLLVDNIEKRITISGQTITYGNWKDNAYVTTDKSYYTKKLPSNIEIGDIIKDEEKAIIKIPLSDIYSKNTNEIIIYAINPIIKVDVMYEGNGGSNANKTKLLGKYDGIINSASNVHGPENSQWYNMTGGENGRVHNGSWESNCLIFNGSTWVDLGFMNNEKITMEITISFDTVRKHQHIIGNWNGAGGGIWIDNVGTLHGNLFIIPNDSNKDSKYYQVDSIITLSDSIIYKVAMTYDGNEIKLYVNGNEVGKSENLTGVIKSSNGAPMAIGCNPNTDRSANGCDNKDQFFEGKVYNATIYGRALTKEEIKKDYQNKVVYEKKYSELPSPERTGFKFEGWYFESEYKNIVNDNTKVEKINDHTLYAKWSPNSYTINYNNNGGNGNITSQNIPYTFDATLTANSFTRSGYTFIGWSTSSDTKCIINETTEVSGFCPSSSTTYTNIKQYTVNQPFTPGAIYRMEADIKGVGDLWSFFYGAQGYLQVAKTINSYGDISSRTDGGITTRLTPEYKHYTVTWTLGNSGSTTVNKYILFRVFPNYSASIKNVRLYKISSPDVQIYANQSKLNEFPNEGTYNLYAIWK